MIISAPLPTSSAAAAAAAPIHFVYEVRDSAALAASAESLIGTGWHDASDTIRARGAVTDALTAVGRALDFRVAPSGHVTPEQALSQARDAQAFLRKAGDILDAAGDSSPAAAQPFLTAAQHSLATAAEFYGKYLQPTPRYA